MNRPGAAVHLAVLAGGDGAGTVCGVLAYDGHGRRHLHPVAADADTRRLSSLLGPRPPEQLSLPLADKLPSPTSAGQRWRTWVLPSIPTALRSLAPEQLAGAIAQQLTGGATP
jgi:hypothetical protein